MMKQFFYFVALIAFTLLLVPSCQKDHDGKPDTPDIPGELHPVPTEGVVDLGLSVLWLDHNAGAVKPSDIGSYFQWAGVLDVSDLGIYLYYDNCPYHNHDITEEEGWLKYCDVASYGNVDNLTVLEPMDDAAYMTPDASKWCQRMPSYEEMDELIRNCTWTLTTIDNVQGYKVQSNIEGYTDKWIFLPSAGHRAFNELYNDGNTTLYWTSTLVTGNPSRAIALSCWRNPDINEDFISLHPDVRYFGLPVRPVIEVKKDGK